MKILAALALVVASASASAANFFMFHSKETIRMGTFSITQCNYKKWDAIISIKVMRPSPCPPWLDLRPDMTYDTPSWFDRSQILPN